jgi:hypothetical protein
MLRAAQGEFFRRDIYDSAISAVNAREAFGIPHSSSASFPITSTIGTTRIVRRTLPRTPGRALESEPQQAVSAVF